MREFSTPEIVSTEGYRNASDLVRFRAQSHPESIAFRKPQTPGGFAEWQDVTISEFEQEVLDVAKGLIANGFLVGSTALIMSETRYEWAVAESAIWYAGGVVVPIYETSSPAQVSAILRDVDAEFAFVEGKTLEKLLSDCAAELGRPLRIETLVSQFSSLKADGASVPSDLVATRRLVAKQEDVATIVYTSGTTASPKAALITHRNLLSQVLNIGGAYSEIIYEGGRTVIFLPLAHVLARGLQLVCLAHGMSIAHLSNPKEVVRSLTYLKPTFLVVVPRVLQKIYGAAEDKARSSHLSKLWNYATRSAVNWGLSQQEGFRSSPLHRLGHMLFDRIFFQRLRKLMGGEIDYLLSGAAALDPRIALFFRGIGIPVVEGYGLTETTAPLTGNLPGHERVGTVGVPMPGATVRISDEGEILAKGSGVFAGYRNPAHNSGAFADGFFRTGDLGSLDESGRLTIKGRLKDVIVTSGGKTISPVAWEMLVENDPLVAHAVTIGEGRPYLSALLVVDPDALRNWATSHEELELLELVSNESAQVFELGNARLREALSAVVNSANEKFSRSEQIKKFTLLVADLTAGSENVTATLKLKRELFLKSAASYADAIYADVK